MNKIYEVIQEESSDCGICSLACIIKYYNGSIPLETLRINTNTNELGTNALELINCAKKYGFDAYGKKIDKLENITSPVIVHLKINDSFYHFVVIYKINKKNIYMMDPSSGMKKMKLDEFRQIFTGIVLYFIPIGVIPKFKNNKFIFEKLKKEYSINKKKYISILLINIFVIILSVVIGMQIKLLGVSLNYIYLLLFVIFINEILIYLKNKYLLKLSLNFNNKIIGFFVNHIFKLPLKYLKLKKKGEIVTRFNELGELGISLLNSLLEIIFIVLLSLIFLIILLFFSIKITSILVIFILIYLIFNINVYKKVFNDIRYLINLDENYNSNIVEYISNLETIKNINNYSYFKKNIFQNLNKKKSTKYNIYKKIYLYQTISNLILNTLLLLILYFIVSKKYSLLNSLTIFILINYILENIKNIVNYLPTYYSLRSIIVKNNDFLSFNDNKLEFVSNFDSINIKKLSYKFNNNYILNDINFNINKNDKIFVNGFSGTGKSTLMRLLNKEYDDYTGTILVNYKDLKEYDVSNIITYVSQDSNLFDGSIIDNITLGINVSKSKLDNILKICRLEKLVNTKEHELYSQILNNSNISGGERNRIVLARSLIFSKEVLILDEVLKEVDIKLEVDILKDLLNYYKNKTIIYISHKKVGFLFSKTLTLERSK